MAGGEELKEAEVAEDLELLADFVADVAITIVPWPSGIKNELALGYRL